MSYSLSAKMNTTPIQNDSGYNTSSSASSVKRVLQFSTCESTPCSSKTRKRKSDTFDKHRKLSNIRELSPLYSHRSVTSQDHSVFDISLDLTTNEILFADGNFEKSSPIDKRTDDLKLSLEKCSLFESIPQSAKKCKWDDEEVSCERKTSSEPGTPQRQDKDSEHSLRKFHSLDLTPTKGTNVKIGTPERLEILYPTLREVKSPSKIKNELKKLTKSRGKRLIQCRDFVYIFTQVKKVDHVIQQIFSYLSNKDLVNVAKVSKLWKKSLESDQETYRRYKRHLKNITVRKENIYEVSPPEETTSSTCLFKRDKLNGSNQLNWRSERNTTLSPSSVNWSKYTRLASELKGAQRIRKCMACARPAVVERGLARCSAPQCGYLWCVRCLAGSLNSEHLNCLCRSPHSPPLSDKSNIDACTSSLYFLDQSSGYYSAVSDGEKSVSFQDKPQALTDCNDNLMHKKRLSRNNNNSSSDWNIVEHSAEIQKAKKSLMTRKKNPVVEPGSPQKVKMYAAGSKQSKRNLKRLIL